MILFKQRTPAPAPGRRARPGIVHDASTVYKAVRRKRNAGHHMPEFGPLISTVALATLVDAGRCRPLDCRFDLLAPHRGREMFLAAHVPGAVYADLDRDLSAPVTAQSGRHPLPLPATLAARLGAWGIGNTDLVVAYDGGSGAVAARAWWLLRWIGHERVAVLDGGYAAWIAEGRPVETSEPARTPVVFEAGKGEGLVVTTAEVAAAVASGSGPLIVDARESARFRGEVEPIDPVAGHVPGAVNFPASASLAPDGRWRAPADLNDAWREVLGDVPGRPWVAMCGSGVTACHLALSACLAGYAAPSLYAGSWSEWIRDPAHPVATGP
jgi:thiosulfate/3-mercaptopyruvate sulfurtransferase